MNNNLPVHNQRIHEKFHRFDKFTCTFQDIKLEIVQGKIWNIPNAIMLARLLLGIFVIQSLKNSPVSDPFLAVPFVVLMFVMDLLDGYLARKLNQQTLFGKTFDPLVDKILIVYGILTLFNVLEIPFTLTIPFFSTHLIMLVGSLFLMLTHRALPAIRSYGAVSNILAVISAIFYWMGSLKIGKRLMLLAITSGYALLVDYARGIKWKQKSQKELIRKQE